MAKKESLSLVVESSTTVYYFSKWPEDLKYHFIFAFIMLTTSHKILALSSATAECIQLL